MLAGGDLLAAFQPNGIAVESRIFRSPQIPATQPILTSALTPIDPLSAGVF